MPFGGDGGRVEVVYVARFDPAVLAEGVVDAVFVVAVSGGVGSDVGAEFEGVVSVLGGVIRNIIVSSWYVKNVHL